MTQKDPWLLPDGIEEILPEDAKRLEHLRRKLLDVFSFWGYQRVIPPLIDYLDSLRIGSGHDLDLQTFKLVDQLNGEMLGIRADMTPQVARIDSHHFHRDWPVRLCYAGTVLHTRGDALERSREPIQIGAELYGNGSIEADLEVINLMLEMLAVSGLLEVHLDLGHVGIFRELSRQAGLTEQSETDLFDVLQRKSRGELDELLINLALDENTRNLLGELSGLNGDREILDKARSIFSPSDKSINQALNDLEQVADRLKKVFPQLKVSFDLAELRGYHYHTGIVFSAFVPGTGKEISRGGRYDNIGESFGRARPATGFSADLKLLSALSKQSMELEKEEKILAPCFADQTLVEFVRDLRAKGCIVIQELPGHSGLPQEMGCTSIIEKRDRDWIINPLK
ncbi:MAG: ATP phosphoribosyltransferase regulatory subunit [Gammaproteobacteria bacterium]